MARRLLATHITTIAQEIDVIFTTALTSDKQARGRRLSPSTFVEACALLCFELHYSIADLEQVGGRVVVTSTALGCNELLCWVTDRHCTRPWRASAMRTLPWLRPRATTTTGLYMQVDARDCG